MTQTTALRCDVCGRTVIRNDPYDDLIAFRGLSGAFVIRMRLDPAATYELADKHWCPWCLVTDITRWVESFVPKPPTRLCAFGGCGQPAAYKSMSVPEARDLYSCGPHRDVWNLSWVPLQPHKSVK